MDQEAPTRMASLEMDANFYLNAGSMVQVWILVLLVFPIVKGLARV